MAKRSRKISHEGLTTGDLQTLKALLSRLARYHERGSECRSIVDKAIEVVDGHWERSVRTNYRAARDRQRVDNARSRAIQTARGDSIQPTEANGSPGVAATPGSSGD